MSRLSSSNGKVLRIGQIQRIISQAVGIVNLLSRFLSLFQNPVLLESRRFHESPMSTTIPWSVSMVHRTTLVIGVCFAGLHHCGADIIAPRGAGAPAGKAIPASVSIELDSSAAERLEPSVAAYMQSRDLELFRQTYQQMAEGVDTLPAFDVFLAKLKVAYNYLPEALGILEQYANDHPEDPEVYLSMGELALKSGRTTDAWLQLSHAQRLIDREMLPAGRTTFVVPRLVEMRAAVAERRKQWVEAEQLYRKLQELKPDALYPTWRAGRVKVMAGELQAGYNMLGEACAKDSTLPPASLSIAQTLHDHSDWLKDPQKAIRLENWYKKAITETADVAGAWASYFKWLLLVDRPEDVVKRFDDVPESIREEREVRLMRSLAARYLNDFDLAERLLSEAHQANPDDLEIADQLALVLVESSDEAKRARALQIAERNLRQFPKSGPLIATAGWIQLRLGSTDIANQLLSQLATGGTLSSSTAYYVAELLEKVGRTQESKQLLKIAADSPGIFPQRALVKKRLEQ